jgi:hypothetical protein
MSADDLKKIRGLLTEALFSVTDLTKFNQLLIELFNSLKGYLKNHAISPQLKLYFALQVFPDLLGIMEMPVWRKFLSEIGNGGNLLIIYLEFIFCATSFPSLVNQEEYEGAIKKLSSSNSSNFPPRLQDLPDFFKKSLLDELERLVKLSESQRRERDRL